MDSSVVLHNRHAEQAGEHERFFTALVVSINGSTEAQAVNYGHVPPYLLRGGAVATPVSDTAFHSASPPCPTSRPPSAASPTRLSS